MFLITLPSIILFKAEVELLRKIPINECSTFPAIVQAEPPVLASLPPMKLFFINTLFEVVLLKNIPYLITVVVVPVLAAV